LRITYGNAIDAGAAPERDSGLEEESMKSKLTIAIVCAVVLLLAALLWVTSHPTLKTLTYSQFLEQVRMGRVASVIITGSSSGATPATCRLKDGNTMRTVLPLDYRDAMAAMQDKMINIEIRDASSAPLRYFANATPFLLLLGVWIILMFRKFPGAFRQGI
jgi:cell division protease FtsH